MIRRRRETCVCGPDLPGTCPGRSACPYSGDEPESLEHEHDAPIYMEVGEELTTCVKCGTRTDYIGSDTPNGERIEVCPHCGQTHYVTDAEEDDDE